MTQTKLESDLNFLCQEAKNLGALDALSSMASDVIVDLRANLKCQVPLCPYYGNNLMCPPYVMKASEFQEILSKYTSAILIRVEISMPEDIIQATYQENNIGDFYKNRLPSFGPVWNKLNEFDELIGKIEAAAFSLGYRFATGLSGGSCKLCDECVAKKPGESCRHPFKARPSMEAMGIDVMKTAQKAGIAADASAANNIATYGLVLVD